MNYQLMQYCMTVILIKKILFKIISLKKSQLKILQRESNFEYRTKTLLRNN